MGKKAKAPPGTCLERSIFESKAFLSLRGFAPQMLILFLGKRDIKTVGEQGRQQRVCVNKDSLTFSYIEAQQKHGIRKQRFVRALDELMAKGFIKIEHQGGAFQKDKSVYALSEQWRVWKEGRVIFSREKDVQRGYRKPTK